MAIRVICQRLCIDDICRAGAPMCGGDFCISCGDACCFDESFCETCREREERFDTECMDDDAEDLL